MKNSLILVFILFGLCSNAQSSNNYIPENVSKNLKEISVEEIEMFKQSGNAIMDVENKTQKIKYNFKINDEYLVGDVKFDGRTIPVKVKIMWSCDHDPHHVAGTPSDLKQYTNKYNCKNWSVVYVN